MKYTINDKKNLIKDIEYLSKVEHIEIFKIIQKNKIKYTQNDNGIFINLSMLDNNMIGEIQNFVNFCIDNKKTLDKKEEIINIEKNKIFSIKDTSSDENTDNDDNIDNDDINNDTINDNKTNNNTVERGDIIQGDKIEEVDVDGENTKEDNNLIDGTKISLKKLKPKYTGVKAKIIKNYK